MAFAMRMKFADIVKKDSFKNLYINGKKNGFTFDIQLAYYRGHFLSDIDELEVRIDGKQIPPEALGLELKGKEFTIYQLSHAITEFWSQIEVATISAIVPGGLEAGEHEIDLKLMLRIPYMAIGPDHNYMPLDSGEKVKMVLAE